MKFVQLAYAFSLSVTLALSPELCHAGSFQVIHSFGFDDGGYGAVSGLTMVGSKLYGTNIYGGSSGAGTVFSMNVDGSGYQVVHSFNFANPVAGLPFYVADTPQGEMSLATLTFADSKLYGVTAYGGGSGSGSIFSMNLDGSGYQDLHAYLPIGGGTMMPDTALTVVGPKLYGATASGKVYTMNLDGSGYQDLHDLPGGSLPGALTLIGSTLIGSTTNGAYSINLDGSGYQVLGPHGSFGGFTIVGSKLYGTETQGGSGLGSIFSMNLDGSGYQLLHAFNNFTGGFYPKAGMTLVGSTLYGTTWSDNANEAGTIFSINLDGTGYQETHVFGPALYDEEGNLIGNVDGAQPLGNLLLVGSTLYGTTSSMGPAGGGTIYALTVPEPSTFTLAAALGLIGFAVRVWRRKR